MCVTQKVSKLCHSGRKSSVLTSNMHHETDGGFIYSGKQNSNDNVEFCIIHWLLVIFCQFILTDACYFTDTNCNVCRSS